MGIALTSCPRKFVFITVPWLLGLFLFCEFILFRWLLPAGEWPYRSTIKNSNDVVRYVYKDSGMYLQGRFLQGFPNEMEGYYRINREGWNSHREYYGEQSAKNRIAIIGDSFVDAHQVKVEQGFPAIVERRLQSKGYDVEVYRFGFGGAPLSQYLHMARYIKREFNPDVYVINIVANDFADSLYGQSNRDGDFLQFCFDDGGWTEVKPRPYKPSRVRMFLKNSATFRYFYQNLSLRFGVSPLMDLLKDQRTYDRYQMNVDVLDFQKNLEKIRGLSRHLFLKLNETVGDTSKLLIVMDGDRFAIYTGEDPGVSVLEKQMGEIAKDARDLDIPVVELGEIFYGDYKQHGQRFDFPHDYHWNVKGHELVGREIAEFLTTAQWLRRGP